VPELTPVANKSGVLLAKRIKCLKENNGDISKCKHFALDYNDYPTTIFTPLEYSSCG